MRIDSKKTLPGIIFLFVAALICMGQVFLLGSSVTEARFIQQVREELEQKANLSLKVFRNNPEQATQILTEQMQILTLDPWGNVYRFVDFPNQYQWLSAGPDKQWDTEDDIIISRVNDDIAAQNQPPLLGNQIQAPAN
jgi:hypothetical protein